MHDIHTKNDIQALITYFYSQVNQDDVLKLYFSSWDDNTWADHLPRIIDFWSSILLDDRSYEGNVMLKHIQLHQKQPITTLAMERWLFYFHNTVDAHYIGDNADLAKCGLAA
jgi:hemoglobin